MANASGVNRIRRHNLRVVHSGPGATIEDIEVRRAEQRAALLRMQIAVIVLLLPLGILSGLLVAVAVGQAELLLPYAVPLLGTCLACVGLSVVMLVESFRHVRRREQRSERTKDGHAAALAQSSETELRHPA